MLRTVDVEVRVGGDGLPFYPPPDMMDRRVPVHIASTARVPDAATVSPLHMEPWKNSALSFEYHISPQTFETVFRKEWVDFDSAVRGSLPEVGARTRVCGCVYVCASR